MRPFFALVLVLFASIVSMAQLNPTTTLAQETGNNSSTANSFAGQSNGNARAGNVSKVDVHTLMYPGHATKMYVNYLPWFGIPDHVSVGYNSADPAQVDRQVQDMVSRGFDGAILDWFGYPETRHSIQVDKSSQLVLQYAQQHPNFEVAIMMDQGSIKPCANTAGCDVTAKLIKDLTYARNTYMQSGSYMRRNGRPVVVSFDLELHPVDWKRVVAALPDIMFIFRNVNGFTRPYTGGSYSWVGVNTGTNDDGTPYLKSFYSSGVNKYPSLWGMGSVHKGFNDTIALWSLKRIRSQECGQTWLKGFNTANAAFNSSSQLDAMQVVTWNDYEEGTEIESGIDNCIAVNASVSGSTLNWGIGGGGQENTINHYEVFISSDGQNLQKLADVAAGTRSMNLSSYSIPNGSYKLFVKAVGKPSIRNQMSNAASYTRSGTTAPSNSGVTISSPAAGSTTGSPVRVAASAAAARPIVAMKVYVNDVERYSVAGGSLDTSLALAGGSYRLVINAWDNSGAVYQSVRNFTVSTATAGTSNPAVTIGSPAAGSTTGSPVRITASAAAARPIVAMKVYVNDVERYSVAGGSLDTSLALAAGSYRLVVNAWDNSGAVSQGVRNFTVSAAPATSGVTITSPAVNSTTGSPVLVSATASASRPITAMKVYLNGVEKYAVSGGSVNANLAVGAGTYSLTVNAWDSAGAVYQSTRTFTVR